MRVTVTREFRDAENGLVLRTVGEKLNLEEKRARYLAEVGVVEITEQKKKDDLVSDDKAQD